MASKNKYPLSGKGPQTFVNVSRWTGGDASDCTLSEGSDVSTLAISATGKYTLTLGHSWKTLLGVTFGFEGSTGNDLSGVVTASNAEAKTINVEFQENSSLANLSSSQYATICCWFKEV